MSELIKVDHEKLGLTTSKALEIRESFKSVLDKAVELENKYNAVVSLDYGEEQVLLAKDLGVEFQKARKAVTEKHKQLKENSLKTGKLIDSFKNAYLGATKSNEDSLKEIVDRKKNLEIKRKQDLQVERESKLLLLGVEFIPPNLGSMDLEMWESYFLGVQHKFNLEREAKEKQEQERLAEEKRKQEEFEKAKAENERLKKEAQEKNIEQEKIKKELEDKKRLEEEQRLQKEKDLQEELSKGDVEKVEDLINALSFIQKDYVFESEKNKKMYESVKILISKTIAFVEQNTKEKNK